MDPLNIIDRPNSYKQPVAVQTNGKLGSRNVIVFQEPNAWDFQTDKEGWTSCCKAIFTKFKETGKSQSIALSCPESHRDEEGVDEAVAREALTSAYSYAAQNPEVTITFIAKNARIRDIYRNVGNSSREEIQEIYGKAAMNRVYMQEGQIGDIKNDVIAITIDELPEIKSASEDFIKKESEEKAQRESQASGTRVAKFEERESKPKAKEGKESWFDYKPPEGEKTGTVSELKTGSKEELHKNPGVDDPNEVRFHVEDDIEER